MRWSTLEWLRRETLSDTPRQILDILAKLEFLRSNGLAEWDTTMRQLSPNRRRFLAGVARRMSIQALAAQPEVERYPLLACFAHWCLIELTDRVLDLFDSYLGHAYARARRDLEEFRQRNAKATNEKVHYFRLLGQVIVDKDIADGAIREQVYQALPQASLEAALAESAELIRPIDDYYLDFLANYYPTLRQFTPRLLAALNWQSNPKSRPLVDAIQLLTRLDAPEQVTSQTPPATTVQSVKPSETSPAKTGLAPVPPNAPQSFIEESWRPYIYKKSAAPAKTEFSAKPISNATKTKQVKKDKGQPNSKKVKPSETVQIDRRYYELCVLWELRRALRAGNIWVEGSRRYARLENLLIPKERWQREKKELCELFGLSLDGATRLDEKDQELHTWATEMEKTLKFRQITSKTSKKSHAKAKAATTNPATEPGNASQLLQTEFSSPEGKGKVWLENGRLQVSRLKKQELSSTVSQLENMLEQLLPKIELPDLLCEVDYLTGFSKQFQHASTGEGVREADLAQLYATILAQATNVGVSAMSRMSGYNRAKLSWLNNWYLYDEPIAAATTTLVNFHYQQPLARLWGDGTLSSSDGQRFAVSVSTSNAQALPRYFGYGRGLSYYTSTSDQLSQFAIKVIPPTLREATYALDGLLDNESDLLLYEHTTDTHGYTELIFGLFDLLGFAFAPRIRDLATQQLYRVGQLNRKEFAQVGQVLQRSIKQSQIVQEWDELMRLVVSLKLGWVSASLVISKLQSYPRQNSLTQVLQEYGRLCKTNFILRYVLEENYRHRIENQLNKGEHLHLLRDQFFIGFGRQLRKRGWSRQQGQADCTNLVTNAIVVWNTLYMQKAIEYLRGQGQEVADSDLTHIWPSRWSHLNVYGRYNFPVEEARNRIGLRDLRMPVASDLGTVGSTTKSLGIWQRTLDEELYGMGSSLADLLEETEATTSKPD